jgi:hypothetical protein
MQIYSIDRKPFAMQRYLNCGSHGRTETAHLRWYRGEVDHLPRGCDALLCASDLQGRAVGDYRAHGGEAKLLGEIVAEYLVELAEQGAAPLPDRVGVLLAGDLYCVPGANKRGGFGRIAPVLSAFETHCKWVVAVAGNHDDLSGAPRGVDILDGDTVDAGGVRVGGVGLICGDPSRPGRRAEHDHLALVERVCDDEPEVLLLHQGPSAIPDRKGHDLIAKLLIEHRVALTVFGHTAWDDPYAQLAPGVGALNVHERVVLLSSRA